jgi:hypothetical protein
MQGGPVSEAAWKVIHGTPGALVAVLIRPENVLARIKFYDDCSRPMQIALTAEKKDHYRDAIERDAASFAELFKAVRFVDIAGLSPSEAAGRVRDAIEHDERQGKPVGKLSGRGLVR